MFIRKILLLVFLLYINRSTGQVITTWAGGGVGGDGTPAISATIYCPTTGCFDKHGNYFIVSALGNVVREIDSFGIIHTIVGTGVTGYGGDGGLADTAKLHLPGGIRFDTVGNLFIADGSNNRIRKVDAATNFISTIAGNGIATWGGDNGIATLASLKTPNDICFDKFGNIYVSDADNWRIRKINTSGIISNYVGTGVSGYSGDNGQANVAQISSVRSITTDDSGNLYIADMSSTAPYIRKVSTSGIISTIAGSGSYLVYNGDSISAFSANISPTFIAFDKLGILYFSDTYHSLVRKIDTNGIILTVAGNGSSGYSGDNGPALSAKLNHPSGIAFDFCNNLYVSEVGPPGRIRKVWFNTDTLPQVSTAITPNDTVITGTQVTTTATATNHGTITSYQWVKNGANAGTNSAYTYTPVNGDSVYCIVTVKGCTGRMYTDTTTAIHLTVTGDAGVAVTTNLTIQTYPNPVTDVLHVATTEPKHYVLHNLMGVTLLQGSVDKQNSIDMKAIPAGIYLLQLTNTQGQREVVRVVKE